MLSLAILAANSPLALSAVARIDTQAIWLWGVVTNDGDAIVEPGESATITLSIDLDPDVDFGRVWGFSDAVFDTLGGDNAGRGGIQSWEVLSSLNSLFGDQTATDGISLFGTWAVQFAFGEVFSFDDPIDVLAFTWTARDEGNYVVSFATDTMSGFDVPDMIGVWVGDELDTADRVEWPITEAAISFQVIPAPSAFLAGGLGFALWSRRRHPSI